MANSKTINAGNSSLDSMEFCMTILRHSQRKSEQSFSSGSSVEIPYYHIIGRQFGVNRSSLDIDIMRYSSSQPVFNRSRAMPETYGGSITRIYAEDVHTGYVRLIREKDITELTLSDLHKRVGDEPIHGPAILRDNAKTILNDTYFLSNAAANKVKTDNLKVTHNDLVFAVHSPYWPLEAMEWITRRRSHGFPSKSVIKQVARYGCDFVQVSHNRLNNDGEWRFSFSKAEGILAISWTTSQRSIYSTLCLLNKKIASSNLCSYYFKTLMFWACEEKPTEFWNSDLLVQSVLELIIQMMAWLKSKFCVNYFIPGNNMMDHLIDTEHRTTDLSHEIDALWRTLKLCPLISEIVHRSRHFDLISVIMTRHIESVAWIKRSYLIYYQLDNDANKNTQCIFAKDLQNALYVELSDIYRGLCFQQNSVSCVNETDKHDNFVRAENQLILAVSFNKLMDREMINNCSHEFVRSMTNAFMIYKSDLSSTVDVELDNKRRLAANKQESLNSGSEYKDSLYSRSAEKHENGFIKRSGADTNDDIVLYMVTDKTTYADSRKDVMFYKEWPGRSPTVNISWFVAKAYLANLYHCRRNVSLTMKTCDDIIDVYQKSHMNREFAENGFPFVLSTQWTSIYDKEIQELLGFYSLCSYVFDASSRSVYLGVCPVQFALYLKLRAKGDHMLSEWTVTDCIRRYFEHPGPCVCDKLVNNGLIPLTMIIVKHICATRGINVALKP